MKLALSPLHSRLAAAGLLLFVLAAALGLVWQFNRQWHDHYDSHIEMDLERLARYQRIIAGRPALEQAITRVKAGNAARFYLKNTGQALAAAELQELVQAQVDAHGLKLDSAQILPRKTEEGRYRVAVAFKLKGRLEDLQKFLHALDGVLPFIYLDKFQFQSRQGRNYRPVPGVEPEVALQMEAYAFSLQSAAKPALHAGPGGP